MVTRVVILAGGNTNDVAERLERAERLMAERVGEVVARSSVMKSEAWGFLAAPFLNRAFVVDTLLEAEPLLDALQAIERELGRNREDELREKCATGERYASRPIDLDILLYGEQHVTTERLTVPHALLLERDFALEPLGEALGLTREEIVKKVKRIEKR